jgi:hypothetical protein
VKKLLVTTLVLCACDERADATPPAREAVRPLTPAPARDTTVRIAPPIKVRWEELSRDARGATVRATVERVVGLDMPFAVEVRLPAGVAVKRGRTAFTLLPNVEAVTVSEELELTWEETPVTDALLAVDGETGVLAFHFKVPYRFGRAEPPVVAPAATGPHLRVGDRDFGPSIPLKE